MDSLVTEYFTVVSYFQWIINPDYPCCFLNFGLFELQFFPKTEKYVSLFMGGDDVDIVDKRNNLRKQIKANIIAAAASGKDLEGIPIILHIATLIN